jgi:hypothetical protein
VPARSHDEEGEEEGDDEWDEEGEEEADEEGDEERDEEGEEEGERAEAEVYPTSSSTPRTCSSSVCFPPSKRCTKTLHHPRFGSCTPLAFY